MKKRTGSRLMLGMASIPAAMLGFLPGMTSVVYASDNVIAVTTTAGTYEFSDVQAAFSVLETGGTVKLLDDVTIREGETVTVGEDVKYFEMDLNGKTFTVDGTLTGGSPDNPDYSEYGPGLTVSSPTKTGTFNCSGTVDFSLSLWTGDTWNFSSEAVYNKYLGIDAGTVNFSSGEFTGGLMINNGGEGDIDVTISGNTCFSNMGDSRYVMYPPSNDGWHSLHLTLAGGYYDEDPRSFYMNDYDEPGTYVDSYYTVYEKVEGFTYYQYTNGEYNAIAYDDITDEDLNAGWEAEGSIALRYKDFVTIDESQIEEYNGQEDWAADSSVYTFRIVDPYASVTGTCGEHAVWEYNTNTKKLTISGEGKMDDWTDSKLAPWSEYRSSIQSVQIDSGITGIGARAFHSCKSLKSFTIPSNVKTIGEYAFCDCTALSDLTIENGVEEIGKTAFKNCSALKSVSIPDSITKLGAYAFQKCTGLENVVLPDTLSATDTGVFSYCSSLDNVTIPTAMTAVAYYCFEHCTSLKNVTFPANLTSIGNGAFQECDALEKVEIPNKVTSIGKNAFDNCDSLADVSIPDSVTKIGSAAFDFCTSLKSITIPGSITSLGEAVFRNTGLESIEIPDSVISIDDKVFENCTSLVSVKLPAKLTYISEWLFNGCTSLTTVNIPEGVTSIGQCAFYNCGKLKQLTIPDVVTTIYQYAFSGTGLSTITLPSALTKTKDHVFSGCKSLKSMTIPDQLTTLEVSFFEDCSALEEVILPDSIKTIEKGAFNGCTSLEEITLPASLEALACGAFDGCTKLKEITIPGTLKTWMENNGVNRAFRNCTGLTDVILSDGITYIGVDTFVGCSNLKNISIPATVTSISKNAFTGCSGLTDVFYAGTETDWNEKVTIATGNDALSGATMHFTEDTGVTGVELSDSAKSIAFGEKLTLTARVIPESAAEKSVTWTSSDETIATVDDNGVVTALKTGVVDITATTTEGGFTASCTVKILPPAPADFKAVAGKNMATVSWSKVTGAAKYVLYRRALDGTAGGWSTVKSGITGSSYKDTELTAGTVYQYRIRAYSAAGWGAYAYVKVGIPDVPAAPLSITAKAGKNGIAVSWIRVSDATKYALYRRVKSGSTWSSWQSISLNLTDIEYSDADVLAGNQYQYRVRGYNVAGWGSFALSVAVKPLTVPAAPASVTAKIVDGKIVVTWTAVEEADKYGLYFREYKDGAWTSWSARSTKLTTTGYTDDKVTTGVRYQYGVRAYNAAGTGAYTLSDEIKLVTIPEAPATITVKGYTGKINVSWSAVDGATKYCLYRRVYSGSSWSSWTAVTTTAKTAFSDTGAPAGQKCQYCVRAYNEAGWGTYTVSGGVKAK